MFWLLLLALMILVPVLAGLHTWRALRREEGPVAEAVGLPGAGNRTS